MCGSAISQSAVWSTFAFPNGTAYLVPYVNVDKIYSKILDVFWAFMFPGAPILLCGLAVRLVCRAPGRFVRNLFSGFHESKAEG